MKFEKKLIACSILATIIGISSVLPLMFLMPATAKANFAPVAGSSESWFTINIPYSYWMTKDGKLDGTDVDPDIDETTLVSHQYMMALNLTLNVDATNYPADARIEYYKIDVTSDKGPVESRCWFVGTVLNVTAFSYKDFIRNFHFSRNDWFDTDTYSISKRNSGMVRHNWEAGFSLLWRVGNAGSGTTGHSGSSDLVSAIREAETLSITVRRVGWVTFSANSTIVTLANNEVIEQIQLERYGEGWLYNNLIPEDELATADLISPVPFGDQ